MIKGNDGIRNELCVFNVYVELTFWYCKSRMASYHIISYRIASYHIISYHIISYHIISYHIISYHIISYHIISYHIISYHIIYHISYHMSYIIYHIIYHIISYITSYIISYHIIYQIISFHITSYHISYHIIYHVISYIISYYITSITSRHITSHHIFISYHIISYHILLCICAGVTQETRTQRAMVLIYLSRNIPVSVVQEGLMPVGPSPTWCRKWWWHFWQCCELTCFIMFVQYSTSYQAYTEFTEAHFVTIGLGDGLVASGNKPLPEPILTKKNNKKNIRK